MGTRYVIAKKTNDDRIYEGVYGHWDGYPTGAGAEIYEKIVKEFIHNKGKMGVSNEGTIENALEAFLKMYVDGHKGGWSSFPKECYCHSPEFVLRDGVNDMTVTGKANDPLYHEYLYIISPAEHKMDICCMKSFEKEYPISDGKVKPRDERKVVGKTDWGDIVDYGHCVYGHVHLATISFDKNALEPDFEAIQKLEKDED